MQDLFNNIASATRYEIAFGLLVALLMAAFLVPMYVTHCTGRKLNINFMRGTKVKAAREWLLGRCSLLYIRHAKRITTGACRYGDCSGDSIEFRFLTISISLTLIPRPSVKFARRAYRASIGKPPYTVWERMWARWHSKPVSDI